MGAVIFVGPSTPAAMPPLPEGVEIRPPAARGDVVRAAREGAALVGLVDGVLGHRLAVTNGEIREAAATVTRIYGAASIGALRAVECPDVMLGIGEIFEGFESGVLRDDDEVACTFTEPDYRLIAYPLVTIRQAVRKGASGAPPGTVEAILGALQALPFHERTESRLKRLMLGFAEEALWGRVSRLLRDPEQDPKRRDALLLVQLVIRDLERSSRCVV